MKKKLPALLLCAVLMLTFAPQVVWAVGETNDATQTDILEGKADLVSAGAATPTGLPEMTTDEGAYALMPELAGASYTYVDENGDTKTTGALTVTPITAASSTLASGWYVVNSNVNRSTITVTGDANLILVDGVALSVTGSDRTAGINVSSGNSLTVYGQSEGTGELRTTGGEYGAGIGGNGNSSDSCGTVTINSGTVIAQGGQYAAGLGSGSYGIGGSITINGGTINATGGTDGAGIGGGSSSSGGDITINGGMVTATGGQMGAGIGSGGTAGGNYSVNGGNITISGGTIVATGGEYGAGIGGGIYASGGNINISGGTLTATGSGDNWGGTGIGGGFDRSGDNIIISGGTVSAKGRAFSAGIGGSGSANAGSITISGGTVMARGGSQAYYGCAAGIGGGSTGSGGTVVLTGGVVFAEADPGGMDVGTGQKVTDTSRHGTLEISGTVALFLKNNNCVAVTTSTHARQTFTNHIANRADYGIPVHWSGNFGAYLRLHTLSYDRNNGNGTAPAQVTQHIDTKASVGSGALSRTGYIFSGWNTAADGGGTNYAAGSTFAFYDNATLYAVWIPRTYTVYYYSNGGSGSTASSSHTYDVPKALAANTFARTGYTFGGWATSPGGAVAYSDGQSVVNLTSGSTVYLYAKWTPHTYTVNYDANGGLGSTASSSHTYGEAKALTLNGFTKTGYTFAGWAATAGGAAVYSNGQSVSTLTAEDGGTVTLYAKWTPSTYTISYDANGGAGSTASSSHAYDAAKALTVNGFTRTGYTFAGWATSAGGAVVYSNEQNVSNLTAEAGVTVTMYAKWTPHTYTVSYDANGGSGSTEPSSHTYDAAKTLTDNSFMRTGYTFAGWATSMEGAVTYADGQSVMNLTSADGGTVLLFAVWTANTYTVNYDANGGLGSTASSSHTYDAAKTLTANGFTRIGYTFAGWATSAGGAAVYSNGQSVLYLTAKAGDTVTLYAKWAPHTYTVSYDANGGIGTTEPSSHTYDVAKPLTPNGFRRAGYAFSGWAVSTDGAYVYEDVQHVNNLTSEDSATVTLFAVWNRETKSIPRGTVITGANVRSGPGSSYSVIGFAPRGTMYLLAGQSGLWYKIYFDGKVGYILSSYFSVSSTTPVPQPSPTPESVQGTIVNCNNSVNVRSGPGTNYSAIGSALKGAAYTVMGQSGLWYKIAFGGNVGYISAGYFMVSSTASALQPPAAESSVQGTIINCNSSVNVRNGPGTNYAIIDSAPKGATYTVIGKSGAWYRIEFNGKLAYISESYFSVSNA